MREGQEEKEKGKKKKKAATVNQQPRILTGLNCTTVSKTEEGQLVTARIQHECTYAYTQLRTLIVVEMYF